MAGHRLIGAYRQDLAAGLPADIAEEVAGGLVDAYDRHLRNGLTADAAAEAAIGEFGEPRLVVDAFRRGCPVRRLARALLVTGPTVGGCWAAALIASRAWDWPVPIGARLIAGPLLAASVVLLVTAVRAHRYQAFRRAGIAGCLGVAMLDASAITTVMVLAPGARLLLVVAACLSAIRLTYVAGSVRRIFVQPAP